MSKLPTTWTTASQQKLKIADMESSHIRNCINLLKREGYVSESTLMFYLTTEGPQGMMAQDCFERECDEVFNRTNVSAHLDAFIEELERRGEPIED